MFEFSQETELREFYERAYRPARHPGDAEQPTCVTNRAQLSRLADYLGRPPTIGDLSDDLIYGAMAWIVEVPSKITKRPRARSSANQLRTHVNAWWNFAADRGWIETRPRNKPYRVELHEPMTWTPAEREKILAEAALQTGTIGGIAARLWWRAWILFLLETGLRRSAAFSIPTANLNLERGVVVVRARQQKHRREQRCYLGPTAREAIADLELEERGVTMLFGDWPYTIATALRHFQKLQRAAGVRVMGFHSCRKSLATDITAKHGKHVACEVLQHSSVAVTARYIDGSQVGEPSVFALLGDRFAAAAGEPQLRLFIPEAS